MTKTPSHTIPAATKSGLQHAYVSRDQLLTLLSPEDAAVVSAAEARASVGSGEEYLDLHHLDHGVREANGPIVNVLPKRAVSQQLWLQILTQTPTQRRGTPS